jgi:ABC-type transport system involved in multi-copper enzyme maturation permease subunit
MKRLWWAQIRAIIRLEMKKTFFAKRGLWVYLLALAPVALFLGHSLVEIHLRGVRQGMAQQTARPLTEQDFSSIREGMTRDEVVGKLGNPPDVRTFRRRIPDGPHGSKFIDNEIFRYSDGNLDFVIGLEDNSVKWTHTNTPNSLDRDSYIFAGVFQFFFIRLAIFFGCLGIFMNLFRGEMLDKSLHFYLLAPIRREVLLAGKFLAGLLAATVIFTTSTLLQMGAMSLMFDSNSLSHFLYQQGGLGQIGAYLGVTILACIGYGSIFLGAGLLFRNPIVPAAVVLIWEAANPLLPALLKKLSVIYYLKSLCPVNIQTDPGMPDLMKLLVSNADPISAYAAVFGLFAVAIVVFIASSASVRRLEINYTTE